MGKIWMPGGGVAADLDVITANAEDVLAGKVTVDKDGEPLSGTITDRGNWSSSELAAGASVTIPGGRHDGSGKVTAKNLSGQTSGTASAAQILSGQTAWVNGSKVTGTMVNRGSYGGFGNSKGNDSGNQRMWVRVPGGYYGENANVYLSWADIRNMAGLTADKLKKNVSIMGLIGSWEGYVATNGVLYNRGAWGSGYSMSWLSPFRSDTGLTITQAATSIAVTNVSTSAVSGIGSVLFGNSGKTFITNPWSKLSITMRPSVYSSYRKPAFGFQLISKSGSLLASGSVSTLSNTEFTASASLSGINDSAYIKMSHSGVDGSVGEYYGFTLYSIILS